MDLIVASERVSGGAIWANPGLELRKTDRTSWPRFSDAAAPTALQLNSNLELTNGSRAFQAKTNDESSPSAELPGSASGWRRRLRLETTRERRRRAHKVKRGKAMQDDARPMRDETRLRRSNSECMNDGLIARG
ncbi:hypothetical protein CFAM422_004616 [Trichoderma lentiforme]|uniref:Uncharacterized protein n=1 Tax=Trichoderma lentiforme TaxID=1567552 RepID=A0A9P4XI46_9HYPO|nr:hypothetical protein CFAM422_004616 [Trichoderma lentiforme]